MDYQNTPKKTKYLLISVVVSLMCTATTITLTSASWTGMIERWRGSTTESLLVSPSNDIPTTGILARNIENMTTSSCTGSGILMGYSEVGEALCWSYDEIKTALQEKIQTRSVVGVDVCNPDRTNPTRALKGFSASGEIICSDIYAN